MKVQVKQESICSVKADAVVVGIFQGERKLIDATAAVDRSTAGMLTSVIRRGDFSGKLKQTLPVYAGKGMRTTRVVMVGLGRKDEFTAERLRIASASAVRYLRDIGIQHIAVPVPLTGGSGLTLQESVRALVDGICLGLYRFEKYKSKDDSRDNNERRHIKRCTLLADSSQLKLVSAEAKKAGIIAAATLLARDLVSMPGNKATPAFLARTAASIAKQYGLKCTALSRAAAKKLGMGAFLGVAQGSSEPPRLIVLEYTPKNRRVRRPVVLLGKAVTFDSGGISLKPAVNMEEMKTDMSGGAAVIGVLQAAAELKLPIPVKGIIPATENLPSGSALKPGDVVTSMSGKTIEIISTDAEGRLVLADALTYAQRFRPAAMIDIATLTGACVIALGHNATGMMGNDDRLIEKVRRAGEMTGERVWQLPLWEAYGEQLKSDCADLKNVGGRPAGSVTAGCFLKEFTGDTPWVHLDIAGTAWTKKDRQYVPKGATGVGVRLLLEVLENWDKK